MAIHLVLRLLEVDIACGAHRFAKFLAQADNGAVELPQFLLRLHLAVAEHKGVVAQGLDLQIVVERGNALQLCPVLMISDGTEQLARFAGRADNETLAVLHQFRLGDGGHAVEILQIGHGDQLIEVLQAQLILRQKDNMLRETVGAVSLGAQCQHHIVDLLQAVDVMLLAHLLEERDQHIAHRGGIVGCAVVVKDRQIEMLRHNVQLMLLQLRQQVLAQDQRVDAGGFEGQPHLAAACADKAQVEGGIVCRQGAAIHKVEKGLQCLCQTGGIGKHGIGDARKTDDLGGQAALGIDEGLETIHDLAIAQHHSTDLRNGLSGHL